MIAAASSRHVSPSFGAISSLPSGGDSTYPVVSITGATSEFERDNIATYELIFGQTGFSASSDFKPTASPVGEGYRQEYEDKNGNPYAMLVVVLPPVSGESRRTIIQTSGDPARAQSLLNGTKLR